MGKMAGHKRAVLLEIVHYCGLRGEKGDQMVWEQDLLAFEVDAEWNGGYQGSKGQR